MRTAGRVEMWKKGAVEVTLLLACALIVTGVAGYAARARAVREARETEEMEDRYASRMLRYSHWMR